VLSLAAAPAITLLPATLYQAVGLINRFEGAADLPLFGVMTLFVAPTVVLLIPELDLLARTSEYDETARRPVGGPAIAGMITVAFIGWANLTSGFDAERPRPSHLLSVQNADRSEAHWVSFDRHLGSWTRKFIPPDTAPVEYETVTWGTVSAYTAPVPSVSLPPPRVAVESDVIERGRGVVTLRLSSSRSAPYLRVRVQVPRPITAAELNGRPLGLSTYEWARDGLLQFNYAGVLESGITLSLAFDKPSPLTLLVEDTTLDVPGAIATDRPGRPAATMPSPPFPRDATTVLKRYTL